MTSAANFDKRLLGLGSGSEFTPGLPLNTATDQIVAHAGGGQASATILTTEINRITTVATAGDSVQMPVAVAGISIQVTNAGANSMNIFPAASTVAGGGVDNINGNGVNAAYALAAGKTAFFFSAAPTVYHALLSA